MIKIVPVRPFLRFQVSIICFSGDVWAASIGFHSTCAMGKDCGTTYLVILQIGQDRWPNECFWILVWQIDSFGVNCQLPVFCRYESTAIKTFIRGRPVNAANFIFVCPL